MSGENAQKHSKLKAKTNKELNEKVDMLENENKMLLSKVNELEVTVKDVVKCLSKYEEEVKKVKDMTSFNEKEVKCGKCDSSFSSKKALKEHKRETHAKSINCKHCDKRFNENWELEIHLKNHAESKKFPCVKCDKEFVLEWRLRKHMENHTNIEGRKCHYYNNFKTCPFVDIGCKFLHEASERCYFLNRCENRLCQFQHVETEKNVETNDTENPKVAVQTCDLCDFKTNNLGGLNRHKTIKHKNKPGNICKENAENVEKEVDDKGDNDSDEDDEEYKNDPVTLYLKEYRKKQKQNGNVST